MSNKNAKTSLLIEAVTSIHAAIETRRRELRRVACEVLEGRVLLSASYQYSELANLASGFSQSFPQGYLAIDAQQNLYGVTNGYEPGGVTKIFELPHGSTSLLTLASIPTPSPINPADLLLDAAGNIYGVTTYGGSSNMGSVYEVLKGSGVVTSIASFNGANGSTPELGLATDAQGNLYGTTNAGGPKNRGTIFEIVKGSNVINTLASFDGSNGAVPRISSLPFDRSGNLYGTTLQGGPNDHGTVFELVKGSKTVTSIYSFGKNSNGGAGDAYGVVVDSAGDIYGTTAGFGTSNQGMVFKIGGANHRFTQIASFNGTNGSGPSGLTLDPDGNLFGTTTGGSPSERTVFEIPRGSNTIITLSHPGGYVPCGVILDSSGNLYGTSGFIIYKLSFVPAPPAITGYTLVNADTDKDIMPIADGMTLDLATLPRRLNMRAVASSNTGSVKLVFDGQSRLEEQSPWAVFGDWNGDYIFGNLTAGSHTLTACAYTGKAGTGTAGPITTLHFKCINKAPAPTSAVTAFVLFNTATGKDIRVLHNYDTLDLSLLPATLGIRVRTSGIGGSVQYVIDGKMNAPAINALLVGQHHLTAIPYSGANATGTSGASLEIHLFVLRSAVAPGLQPA